MPQVRLSRLGGDPPGAPSFRRGNRRQGVWATKLEALTKPTRQRRFGKGEMTRLLDLKFLLRTIPLVLRRRGAN